MVQSPIQSPCSKKKLKNSNNIFGNMIQSSPPNVVINPNLTFLRSGVYLLDQLINTKSVRISVEPGWVNVPETPSNYAKIQQKDNFCGI